MLTQPYIHWKNSAEGSCREILRLYKKKRVHKGVQKRLFSYLINWCCNTRNTTALDIPELYGKTPWDRLISETDDISHLLMYDFYDPVKYTIKTSRENPTYPKQDKDQIGRYVGLARNATKVNAYYFLTQQVRVVTHTVLCGASLGPCYTNHIDAFNRKSNFVESSMMRLASIRMHLPSQNLIPIQRRKKITRQVHPDGRQPHHRAFNKV